MKAFFDKYSHDIVKMFVYQFAISIFGLGLFLATSTTDNNLFTGIVSAFSILFYLFLLYNMTWEIGAKDRIAVDTGKKAYLPHTGLVIALWANIPNFIIAIVFTVAYPFINSGVENWASNTAFITQMASFFVQGMYRGILSVIIMFESRLYNYWWTYFIIIIPALVTCWLAYFVGHKNFKFTSLFTNAQKNQ